MIICCYGRKAPLNYYLLFGFTACETFMVGTLTAMYDTKVVVMAGLATALVTIALTAYAMKTSTKLEVFSAMVWVVYLAMLPLMIIGLFIKIKFLYTIYCCLGLLFYSLFLIIDTMMIIGGKSMNGQQCDLDDYVVGAMMLYLDIIMIFVYLLQLFGDRN
mmetsp:Transcript_21676/g.33380  ORF Transcript_21676/g.33380 Transcript_21676/m.33380 type:complete len:160 (-) Transcript_21676:38-517(-)